ncbi:hypothetical protein J6590_101501, partial [Homalodisca vitripennis]
NKPESKTVMMIEEFLYSVKKESDPRDLYFHKGKYRTRGRPKSAITMKVSEMGCLRGKRLTGPPS